MADNQSYYSMTMQELIKIAREYHVTNYSIIKKVELINKNFLKLKLRRKDYPLSQAVWKLWMTAMDS